MINKFDNRERQEILNRLFLAAISKKKIDEPVNNGYFLGKKNLKANNLAQMTTECTNQIILYRNDMI